MLKINWWLAVALAAAIGLWSLPAGVSSSLVADCGKCGDKEECEGECEGDECEDDEAEDDEAEDETLLAFDDDEDGECDDDHECDDDEHDDEDNEDEGELLVA